MVRPRGFNQPLNPRSAPDPSAGERLFLEHLLIIDRVIAFVCRRHHLSPADAEDLASHVRLKLMEAGYATLRKFQGRSSIKTFLAVTIERIFLDYRIAAWGKWRPSAEARRGGAVAILLEQLLERDGFGFEEAFEILTINHRISLSRDAASQIASRLPTRFKRRFEPEAALANVPAVEGADVEVIRAQRVAESRRLAQALNIVLRAIPVQDQLVLRLRFEDGRSVSEIASMLRLDQKPLYRRLDRLFQELRRQLEAQGIKAEDVRELTGEWTSGEDSSVGANESAGARPSIRKGADTWL
jgi:RNA polymerase sigma factor for flagellar operon FliA